MRLLLAILLLSGCVSKSSMKKMDNAIFLHDNSSKVWLVDKKIQEDRDYTPMRMEYKELLVMHQNGHAYFYKMGQFGKQPGVRMDFTMNGDRSEFELYNSKHHLLFRIKQCTRTRLVLESKKKDYPYTLVLIPFPEY